MTSKMSYQVQVHDREEVVNVYSLKSGINLLANSCTRLIKTWYPYAANEQFKMFRSTLKREMKETIAYQKDHGHDIYISICSYGNHACDMIVNSLQAAGFHDHSFLTMNLKVAK